MVQASLPPAPQQSKRRDFLTLLAVLSAVSVTAGPSCAATPEAAVASVGGTQVSSFSGSAPQ